MKTLRFRLESSFGATRVYDADTGEQIANAVACALQHEVGGTPVVTVTFQDHFAQVDAFFDVVLKQSEPESAPES